ETPSPNVRPTFSLEVTACRNGASLSKVARRPARRVLSGPCCLSPDILKVAQYLGKVRRGRIVQTLAASPLFQHTSRGQVLEIGSGSLIGNTVTRPMTRDRVTLPWMPERVTNQFDLTMVEKLKGTHALFEFSCLLCLSSDVVVQVFYRRTNYLRLCDQEVR